MEVKLVKEQLLSLFNNADLQDACVYKKQLRLIISTLLNSLSDREKDIIKRRFGMLENKEKETRESIAKTYDVTPSRIQQIENRALEKLRRPKNLKILKKEL